MLYHLPDGIIEQFIEEDLPYGDLTTSLLGIGNQQGTITFTTREKTVVCCSEEAARVLERCGASVNICQPSGTVVDAGIPVLSAKGSAESLHAAWKVALNLLEYASGIATRTQKVVTLAKEVNPGISVLATRKSFPGTKKIVLKAIMAGGAQPHRTGLSDSILIFRQHINFLYGTDRIESAIRSVKAGAPEHTIIAEAESEAEALLIAAAGADVVQIDKLPPDRVAALVGELRKLFPCVKISAAGGINGENAALYAATGVDILVLSSVYFGRPADIGVSIHP